MADISIIVPIYNAEKYLDRCIASLINQTKKELEFILINDGSTDNSEEIIKKYDDKRIKYFKNKNQGIGKTRNFGIEKSTGKYLMFLDSDDYLDETACEKLYEKATREKTDLIVFDFYRVEEKLNPVIIKDFKPTTLKENPNILLDINLGPSNKLFKRDLIEKNNIKFIENLKYEDTPFITEALDNAKKITKLNEFLHYYVIHSNSETTIRDKKVFDIIKIVDIIRKYFEKKKYMSNVIDKLTVKILTNYTIQQRVQEDKKIGMKFIDEAFKYLKENVPDYKDKKYYENRGKLKQTIEKNKTITKIYCKYYKPTINNILITTFYIVMSLLFTYILMNIIVNNNNPLIELNKISLLTGPIIYVILMFIIFKLINKCVKNKQKFYITTSIIFIVLQLIFAYIFAVIPSWDFGDVFHTTLNHLNGIIPLHENSYYYKHSNNLAWGIMLTLVFSPLKLVGVTNPAIYGMIGIMLNIICIDIALYYVYKIIKKFFNEDKISFFWIMTLLFTPFITYVPIFYTDTISLPFAVAGIYYLLQINQEKNIKNIIIAGLLLGIGANLKFSVFIIIVAFLIYYLIFEKENLFKTRVKNIIIFLIFSIIPILLLNTYKGICFNKSKLEKESFPVTHYVMMGLKNKGGYNKEDDDFTKSIDSKEKKQEAHIKEINKRYTKLKEEKKLIQFYTNKMLYTWGDGTFFATAKLNEQQVKLNKTDKYILPGFKENYIYTLIAQSQLIITILFIIIGMLLNKYLTKEQKSLQLFLNIIIFGFLLFLLIWETRSRYIVNIIPILLLNSYFGIQALNNKIKNKYGN